MRTKIMMQPMRPTGGSDKYDNDEKLKTRLLEQTGCSDVKAALAVVAKVGTIRTPCGWEGDLVRPSVTSRVE